MFDSFGSARLSDDKHNVHVPICLNKLCIPPSPAGAVHRRAKSSNRDTEQVSTFDEVIILVTVIRCTSGVQAVSREVQATVLD